MFISCCNPTTSSFLFSVGPHTQRLSFEIRRCKTPEIKLLAVEIDRPIASICQRKGNS